MQFCFNNAELSLCYVYIYFFYHFIGFVRWACIFFENTPRSVRDLPWSRAAGTRAWLAEIHFERFTCRAEIACLVHVCHEALCLDGNVCHQFSPRRWVVRQPVRGVAREGDFKTATGILGTDACRPPRLLTTSAIIPKMFKSVQHRVFVQSQQWMSAVSLFQ